MPEILNKCYSISIKTIGIVIIFVISVAFSFGIWMNSISNDITAIKEQQTHINTFLESHVKQSDAVVKRAERVTTLVANKCCPKGVSEQIEDIMYPN